MTSKKKQRRPPFISPPPLLASLMALANQLPKELKQSGASSESNRVKFLWEMVRDYWDTRSGELSLNSALYLSNLIDALPIELQAFVLHEDEGRYVRSPDGLEFPVFDPSHLQPATNIDLLREPQRKLVSLVKHVKSRFQTETEITIQLVNRSKSTTKQHAVWIRRDYFIDGTKYREIGLGELSNRARERLFFVFAADELLDALTSENAQRQLNACRYAKQAGSLSGSLFIKDDAVCLHPPLLFRLVLDVQVSRIGRCRTCKNYFWAGRKDKKVCSPRCGATDRKRSQRQRDHDRKLGIKKGKRREENGTQKSKRP